MFEKRREREKEKGVRERGRSNSSIAQKGIMSPTSPFSWPKERFRTHPTADARHSAMISLTENQEWSQTRVFKERQSETAREERVFSFPLFEV